MSFLDDQQISQDFVKQVLAAKEMGRLSQYKVGAKIGLNETEMLCYLTTSGIKEMMGKAGIGAEQVPGMSSQSDLLPGLYEGGFKVWESSKDLIQFISSNNLVKGKTILEIGCGSGLVGITCLLEEAQSVYFQDYNQHVLKWFALPNVIANIPHETQSDHQLNLQTIVESIGKKCKFLSGDWKQVADSILNLGIKFDLILTSETIYNEENYEKLVDLIKASLSPEGEVYVAGKTYYFGVGGGMRSFEDYLEKDAALESSVCQVIDAPVQREILRLSVKR